VKKIFLLIFLSSLCFANVYDIISNPVYTNIFSEKNKIPEIGIVHLTWKIVKQHTKRRNNFHTNKIIPLNVQANNKDYKHSGFDKGHFSANNADWDNNRSDMKYTFAFTNMTPQHRNTNRRSYYKVEKYGRLLTKKYKSVFVIDIAVPGNKFMKGNINIPSEYFKIFIFNNEKQCFRIPNDNKIYKLKQMKINCKDIKIKGNL